MTKKSGTKKKVITILSIILLSLFVFVPFAMMYHNYTKELCVMEPVEHMEQREGVSMGNIIVEIEYAVRKNGEEVENYLYVFENGDVYSGSCINYFYMGITDNQEQREMMSYAYRMDDGYWNYLDEQCYWGRLSPRDLNSILNELDKVEIVHFQEDHWPEPAISMSVQDGIQDGIQLGLQLKSQEGRTENQETEDFYGGHRYRGRMGTEGLEWISRGSDEKVTIYRNNQHAQNVIDIIKSTWAYEQWTNQIFGEGWEERINLKDELEEGKL